MDTQDVCSSLDSDLTAATAHALDDMQAVTWDRIREATTSDPIMFKLCQIIEDGLPQTKPEYPPLLREYFNLRDYLSTTDDVILYKDRIVIPLRLREEVLLALHSAHQGIASMTARSNIFWLFGMVSQHRSLIFIALNVTGLHPISPMHHPLHLSSRNIPFNEYVQTSFLTRESTILL